MLWEKGSGFRIQRTEIRYQKAEESSVATFCLKDVCNPLRSPWTRIAAK